MRIDEGHKEKTGHPFSEITQTTLARTGLLPEGCSHCRASEPGIGRTTLRSWASSSDPHIHLVPRANADSSDSSATSCCQPASGTSSGQPPRPSLRENLAEAEGHGPSVLLPLRPAARRRSHGRLPPLPPLWFHPSKVLADDKVASHPTAQRLLNVLKPIFDDVWKELISEGVFELPSFDEASTRTRLAYKVLTFASTDWTETQMRQLLLRAFRNEVARLQRAKSLGPRAAAI
jgi:hypothetical protein